VTELRWQRFPIRVYVEEVELLRRGFSSERSAQIVQLILQGLGSWAGATNGRVGGITYVVDSANADLNIVFRNNTGHAVHDSREENFIRHATILGDIHEMESFGVPATRTIDGRTFTDGADHRIVNWAAHEMGHVLGIVQHPTIPGSLMIAEPEQVTYEAPQAVDVNSMLKKYGFCV
jgi:hypothetical protein